MRSIIYWLEIVAFVAQYFLFRLRLAAAPDWYKHIDAIQHVCGVFTGWNRFFRLRGGEHVPTDHAAIFYGNHHKFGDPFHLFRGAFLATDGKVKINAMTRDDFFIGTPFKTLFFDTDDFIKYVGVHGINRDKPTLSQMKTFLNLLKNGEGFILFPGGTRSRSGMLMEYRENFQEPGGISFFLNMIQRQVKDEIFSAVISMRNYNPVRDHTSVVFGPEQFLKKNATKEEQRDFDLHLVEVMGGYVEVCVPQVLAAVLYARCLHSQDDPLSVARLQTIVRAIMTETDHPYLDPEDMEDLDDAVTLSLAYFQKLDLLKIQGDSVQPDKNAILSNPELDSKYRKKNPVKYLTNQLLHLGGLIELIQEEALGD